MIDCNKIKSKLENEFHLAFDISYSYKHDNFIVRLKDTNKELFEIIVEIKNNIRLNITAKPDQYGIDFLSLINKSSQTQRLNFCDLWDKVGDNLTLYINGIRETKDSFTNNQSDWKTFEVTFSKAPYYELKEDSDAEVVKYISLICGMMLSLFDYSIKGYVEGNAHEEVVTKYERNPINRELCLYLKGYKCSVCGFDFEETYGDIGKEFIEVHHTVMVSTMGENYHVDINNDLSPVCSNCHAMLHRKFPPYTIDEMKEIIERNKKIKLKG